MNLEIYIHYYNNKTFCYTPTLYSIVSPLIVYVITEEFRYIWKFTSEFTHTEDYYE